MSLNFSRTKLQVSDIWGGVVVAKEINEDGTDLSATGNQSYDLGYIVGSEFNNKATKKKFADDTTNPFLIVYRDREPSFTTNLQQSGLPTLNLPDESKDKFYRLYVNKNNNPNYKQHRLYFQVVVDPNQTVKQGDEKVKVTFDSTVAPSDITFSASALTGALISGGFNISTTATTVTISAGQP
jgi:hypothetical protein